MSMIQQNAGGLAYTVVDDGSNYDFKVAGVTQFSIRKSDKQLLLAGGVNTDETL